MSEPDRAAASIPVDRVLPPPTSHRSFDPVLGSVLVHGQSWGAAWDDPALRGQVVGLGYVGVGLLVALSAVLPGGGALTVVLGVLVVGLGACRALGVASGLVQLAWSGVALTTCGLVVVVAAGALLEPGGVGAGPLVAALLGAAGVAGSGGDLVALWREEPSMPAHRAEPAVVLALGLLSTVGVAPLGPAAVALGLLVLRRDLAGAPTETARNLLIAGTACGGIGTLGLAVLAVSVLR